MGKYVLKVEELQKAIDLLEHINIELDALSRRITNAYCRLKGQKSIAIENALTDIFEQGKLYDIQWDYIKKDLKGVLQGIIDETILAEERARKEMAREERNAYSLYMKGSYYNEIVADKTEVWGLPYDNGCTWHTAKKLSLIGVERIRGLRNGVNWFEDLPERDATEEQYGIKKYAGNNWYEKLMAEVGGGPVYNVVLSFEKNDSLGLEKCGHVMMIDAIIDGVVYFTDTNSKREQSMGIEVFKRKYAQNNGNCMGAAYFYK